MEEDWSYEAKFLEQNGYVVFRKHLSKTDCDILSNVGLKTLFTMAFGSQKDRPEPTFENMKFFSCHEERKKLKSPACIWVNNKADQPLCSKVTGLCYGSYLREVQEKFTMTLETYEKLSACYGTANIAQIYGPKRYSIRMKGGHKSQTLIDWNLLSDYNNVVTEQKIITSLITTVDESVSPADSGTICLIPRFNLYRYHARIFFNFVGGESRLPLNLESPLVLDDDFLNENLAAFNKLLSELHRIRDKKLKPEKHHQPYLKLSLPDRFYELEWKNVQLSQGDMLCRSHWLPYYHNPCNADIPLIAFHVGYYRIPDDFLGSYKQRRLIAAIEQGHTMEECREWEEARNNTCETYLRRKEGNTVYFYVPDDEDAIDFAMFIQCLDTELSITNLGTENE